MSRRFRELTVERLRAAIRYDEVAGHFFWRIDRQGHARAGDRAGSIGRSTGYEYIFIDGRRYCSHRLAWLCVHGCWPTHEIDHINGTRTDNAIANLRDVPRGTNHQNRRKARSDSTTGVLGVVLNGKRFSAHIQVDKKLHYLGTFDTAQEAGDVYLEAKRRLHPGNML